MSSIFDKVSKSHFWQLNYLQNDVCSRQLNNVGNSSLLWYSPPQLHTYFCAYLKNDIPETLGHCSKIYKGN